MSETTTADVIQTPVIRGSEDNNSRRNPVFINETLKIHHATNPNTTNYNGRIELRDIGSSSNKLLYLKNNGLYVSPSASLTDSNNYLFLHQNNVLSELNSIIYEDSSSGHTFTGATDYLLKTSNISVLGQGVQTSGGTNGYLNFGFTQGESGFGIKFDKTNQLLRFKNPGGSWTNFGSSTVSSTETFKVYTDFSSTINEDFSESTMLFKVTSSLNAGTYTVQLDDEFSLSSGRKLNIIFDGGDLTDRIIQVDFGSNKLFAGSGKARYLKFNSSGQSASLVYIGEGLNRWQVLNTGAAVA
tara:strand:- start:470 stop:1366 length:897 start_codon:yes stop_codon:yes gene_type:complete